MATATTEPTATAEDTGGVVASSPAAIPHSLEGRDQCNLCHGPDGSNPSPADHAARTDEMCTVCHEPATESGAAPEAAATPTTEQCLACHGPIDQLIDSGAVVTLSEGSEANPHTYVPHDSETPVDCTLCHAVHPVAPTEADLAALPEPNVDYCFSCHHERVFAPCSQCH